MHQNSSNIYQNSGNIYQNSGNILLILIYIAIKFNIKYARKSYTNMPETVVYYIIIYSILLQNL